jgi:hypothetical protein
MQCLCEGRQEQIAPLNKVCIVATGTANWLGEKTSLFASLIWVRCKWICSNSQAEEEPGMEALRANLCFL